MSDEREVDKLPKLYSPREVAKRFGITTDALKSRRQRGQIECTVVDGTVLYTEEQIQNADLSPRKRGPKPKEKRKEPKEPDAQALCVA